MQTLVALIRDQRSALRFILSSPRVLVPATVRWVERFGGGIGSPVIPFFMLALTLSPSQMGVLSTISVYSALLTSPLYGMIQDSHGTYYPIIVASLSCGIGCTLEGTANGFTWLAWARFFQGIGGNNLPSVINAHLTVCTPPARRALVLSAYVAQCLLLRICGQLFYLPWDSMLQSFGLPRMWRFRVTLSVCSLFCWFGVFALLYAGNHLRQPQAEIGPLAMEDDADSPETAEERAKLTDATSTAGLGAVGAARPPSRQEKEDAQEKGNATADVAVGRSSALTLVMRVGPCLLCLLLNACYESLLQTTWPLFMNTHYGWGEDKYAGLIFVSTSVSALTVALYPRLHATLGGSTAVLTLALTLAASALLAFTLSDATLAPYHATLALLANGCVAALTPAIQALASTLVTADKVGRLFAAMNIAVAFGRSLAGLVGMRLYELSVGLPAGSAGKVSLSDAYGPGSGAAPPLWLSPLGPLARGGALPTALLAPLLVGAVLLVHCSRPAPARAEALL